ncbi:unnamed protein product [Alopecurus aequalis]
MAKEVHKSGLFGLPELPPDFSQILQEARNRWLRPIEICQILWNYKLFAIAREPPNRPPSGSLFLFDRKILRYFRGDGHNWRKKKDRKTVKEAHERLKIGSLDVLHAYYALGDEKASFQRRTYFLLEPEFMRIVLVHYLEVRGSKQSFSHMKEAEEITGSSNVDNPACSSSFGSQSEVANPTMDAERPISLQFSEYEDAETDNSLASSMYHRFVEMQRPVDGAMMDNLLDAPALSTSVNSLGSVFKEAGALSSAGMPSSQDDNYTDGSIRYTPSLDVFKTEPDRSKKFDGFSSWMSNELAEVPDLDIKSSSDAFWRSTENVNVAVNEQLDPYVVSPSFSQDQLFSIIDVSPSWAYTRSKTKVLITGTFLVNKEDVQNCKWSCTFGDVEVLAEVLADGSLRCYTPVHQSGRVPIYVTCSNRVACSDVREFEFHDSEAQYVETTDPHTTGVNEMDLRIRLEKLLFLGPDDYKKYVLSGKDEKSELINTINLLMLDDKLSNLPLPSDEREFPSPRNKNHEKLVKEKLYHWLIHKIYDDVKGPSMLGKDGQGVIHLVAALGYNWAIRPIIAVGVHVNSRDPCGWTALHWAASCGRERTVGTLIANEAASGALTDPTPQFPSGRTAADLASENGHKGIAGFLAESSLTSHLSALVSKEPKGDNLKLIYESADTNEFAEPSSNQLASQDSQAESLKDSLNAVRKSTQAAARIFQAFRVESFRRNKVIEYGDDDCGLSDERTLPLVSLINARPGQNKLHSAAVRIQNKFRGWKGRKEFMLIRQKSSRYRPMLEDIK